MARAAIAAAVLLLCLAGDAKAEEAPKNGRPVPKNITVSSLDKPSTQLTGSSKGSGVSCVPTSNDFYGPGTGCSSTEACCPTTNTCMDRTGGCSQFAKSCPMDDCGDTDFEPIDCPAEVTKLFKKAGTKCLSSNDMLCFTNLTMMATRCSRITTSAAGEAAAPRLLVYAAASLLAAALAHLVY